MNTPDSHKKAETRMVFRVLAGFLAAVCGLFAFPLYVSLAIGGPWHFWLAAANNLFMGIGFFCVARTGQWFRFRRHHETKVAQRQV